MYQTLLLKSDSKGTGRYNVSQSGATKSNDKYVNGPGEDLREKSIFRSKWELLPSPTEAVVQENKPSVVGSSYFSREVGKFKLATNSPFVNER